MPPARTTQMIRERLNCPSLPREVILNSPALPILSWVYPLIHGLPRSVTRFRALPTRFQEILTEHGPLPNLTEAAVFLEGENQASG